MSTEELHPLRGAVLDRPGIALQISKAEPLSRQHEEREKPTPLLKQCQDRKQ